MPLKKHCQASALEDQKDAFLKFQFCVFLAGLRLSKGATYCQLRGITAKHLAEQVEALLLNDLTLSVNARTLFAK